ncbi:MAG: pantoate--beta-alanine ligase [Pseudomonadota bacterium]
MPKAIREKDFAVERTLIGLRAQVDCWKADKKTIALVPTMGALHEGHLSLVEKAISLADCVVVSIFVNPKQFAVHEDLDTYPSEEKADLGKLEATGCHLAYLPSGAEMYPAGFDTAISVGAVASGLCADSRPHFFGGVATVVCKLLNQVQPTLAVFGEKDFQQLHVIRRMVADLDMPMDIIGGEIVREPDGLAMSSRNAYLSPDERQIAAQLNKTLMACALRLEAGEAKDKVIGTGIENLVEAGFDRVDYLEMRDATDLSELKDGIATNKEARLLAAAVIGKTRLIDNWPINRRNGP